MEPFTFDRVVLLGESVLKSLGDNAQLSNYFADTHGLSVALTNASVVGDTSADALSRLPSVISSIPEGEVAVFVVHLGGVEIQELFEDVGTAREDYESNITDIYNAVTSSGHICIICTISFMQFGTPESSAGGWTGGNSYDNPIAYGVDKVNTEVLIPLVSSLDGTQIGGNGRPYLDLHNWSYNHGPALLNHGDGENYSQFFAAQRWLCDRIYNLSVVGADDDVIRVVDPRRPRRPKQFNLNFKFDAVGSNEIKGVTSIYADPIYLSDSQNSPTSVLMTPHAVLVGANTGLGDPNDKGVNYLSGAQTLTYHRVNAGDTRTYTITGLTPGSEVSFSSSASRNIDGISMWITKIILNGVSLGEKNAASITEVATFHGVATIGPDGTLEIVVQSPSYYGYLNSAELIITYPPPNPDGGLAKLLFKPSFSQLFYPL